MPQGRNHFCRTAQKLRRVLGSNISYVKYTVTFGEIGLPTKCKKQDQKWFCTMETVAVSYFDQMPQGRNHFCRTANQLRRVLGNNILYVNLLSKSAKSDHPPQAKSKIKSGFARRRRWQDHLLTRCRRVVTTFFRQLRLRRGGLGREILQ